MMRFSKKRSEFGKKKRDKWLNKKARSDIGQFRQTVADYFQDVWLRMFGQKSCDGKKNWFFNPLNGCDKLQSLQSTYRKKLDNGIKSDISGGVCLKMSKKWFQIKGFNHSHNSIQTNIGISRHVDQSPNTV